MPLPGQSTAPFATQERDFVDAPQELEFPRNRNKLLFLNENWLISKPKHTAHYMKFDCCNIQQGGHIRSIDCAFKRVIEERGNLIRRSVSTTSASK